MTEEDSEPATQLREEPQEERGAVGSRDTGSDEPAGGPVERPVAKAEPDDSTGVDEKRATEGAQTPVAGDQGG